MVSLSLLLDLKFALEWIECQIYIIAQLLNTISFISFVVFIVVVLFC